MAKIYYEEDADLEVLQGKRICVVGYGIQGRAQALNLRDSGLDVICALREGGESWCEAKKDGMDVAEIPEAVAGSVVVMMLIPDEVQAHVYEKEVGPYMKEGATLDFAHGFNIVFRCINPPRTANVVMVAPKAPGAALRDNFLKGHGVPALVAVEQDYTRNAKAIALAIAKGIGSTRAGVIETTFREETETDLFGEQVDLCGGVSELIKASFAVLVESGYQPELAYFEVLHELKMIVDLIQQGGIENMWANVSNTAEYGGRTRGKLVVDDRVKKNMLHLLSEIKSGVFAKDWIGEYERGMPTLKRLRQEGSKAEIERVGESIRRMFR